MKATVPFAGGMKRLRSLIALFGLVMLVAGLFAEHPIGYLCATFAVLATLGAWIVMGTRGIPALPIVAALYYLYYIVPLLRNTVDGYTPDEYQAAGLAVATFLGSATCAWVLVLRVPGRRRTDKSELVLGRQFSNAVTFGLLSAIVFFAFSYALIDIFGAAFGVVRSVMLTVAVVACYLFGHGLGRKMLTGWRLLITSVLFSTVILVSVLGLFLAGAAAYLLAAITGYVLAAKRIPFVVLGVLLAFFTILHAGKGDMRDRYWTFGSQGAEVSTWNAPLFLSQWVAFGITNLADGKVEETTVVDRTSLLQQLVLVMHLTPDIVPYSDGVTYAMLLRILVPRFIDPDKPVSQAGVNYLSVRYGLQSVEATRSTTLSWGLIPEAFANFGWLGVLSIGFLFGVVTGLVSRLSAGVPPLSTPFIAAVAAMVALFNVEADFGLLALTIVQSLASAVLFATGMRVLMRADGGALATGGKGPLIAEGRHRLRA